MKIHGFGLKEQTRSNICSYTVTSLYVKRTANSASRDPATVEYQTPPPLDERQCIAIVPPPTSRRCRGQATVAETIEAARYASLARTLSGQQKAAVIRQVMLLHVRELHWKALDFNNAEIDQLVKKYERSLPAISVVRG